MLTEYYVRNVVNRHLQIHHQAKPTHRSARTKTVQEPIELCHGMILNCRRRLTVLGGHVGFGPSHRLHDDAVVSYRIVSCRVVSCREESDGESDQCFEKTVLCRGGWERPNTKKVGNDFTE
jgi:hypothetical protein